VVDRTLPGTGLPLFLNIFFEYDPQAVFGYFLEDKNFLFFMTLVNVSELLFLDMGGGVWQDWMPLLLL
jgi:hypothetical protein